MTEPGRDTQKARVRTAARYSFPRRVRLRKRAEFLATQRTGKKFHARHFLAVVARSEGSAGRVGITVTKKVGNAVTRNRIKRLVREVVRQTRLVPPGVDAVLIAKHSAADLRSYREVAADLARLESRLASC
jgi:ribonuclease P protein component